MSAKEAVLNIGLIAGLVGGAIVILGSIGLVVLYLSGI